MHEFIQQLQAKIAQAGSLVAPERLRFDFTAREPLGAAGLQRVQQIANSATLANKGPQLAGDAVAPATPPGTAAARPSPPPAESLRLMKSLVFRCF